MQRTSTHLLIIIAIGCLVLFTNLGKTRLWDRDEPRNAGCALEMMERGNLVVPMFNNELRPQKPALLYWLIISAYELFGVGEFAARFWSAVLGIGTILATYGIGRRLLNPMAALFGSLILTTSMMFVVAGRAATPDSILIFCSTMAMLFYVLGTFARKANPADAPTLQWDGYYFPQKLSWVIAMYAMLGLAVLAKGPVGFVLPCAIIGMFMLIQRLPIIDNETWNSRGWIARMFISATRPFHPVHFVKTLWQMRPFTLAIVVLAIAAPWYVMVGLQTNWDWPQQFLFTENLARATSTFENHRGGLFYYPLAIVLGFFPWSVFMGPMAVEVDRQVTRRHHWRTAYVFLLCWVGVQIGLFSLAQTKLPSYITPCYPALAMLTGAFLYQWMNEKVTTTARFNRLSFITLIASGVLICVALAFTGNIYLAGDIRIAMVGLIPIIGGGLALLFYVQNKNQWSMTACLVSAVVFATGTFGFAASAVDRHQHSDVILARLSDVDTDIPVATFGCLESSWVYYAERPIYELTTQRIQGDWSDDRQNDWDKKPWPSPEQFAEAHPKAMIITTEHELENLLKRLPGDFDVVERAPYFLRDKDLVLLQRKATQRVAKVESDNDDGDSASR